MAAIDTNVLVRLIVQDDAKQTASALSFTESGVWVPLLVLVESVWVLSSSYSFSRTQVRDAIERLLNLQNATIESLPLAERALQLFTDHNELSYSDCVILETARQAGQLPLGSFDRALTKLPGTKKL